jgi:hypothetical protein
MQLIHLARLPAAVGGQAKPAMMFGYLFIENLSFLFPKHLLYLARHGRAAHIFSSLSFQTVNTC